MNIDVCASHGTFTKLSSANPDAMNFRINFVTDVAMKPNTDKRKEKRVNQLCNPLRHTIPKCNLEVVKPLFDRMIYQSGIHVKNDENRKERWQSLRHLFAIGFSEVSSCLKRQDGLNVVLVESSLHCFPLIQVT